MGPRRSTTIGRKINNFFLLKMSNNRGEGPPEDTQEGTTGTITSQAPSSPITQNSPSICPKPTSLKKRRKL
uniref:Uncharacterized protein n=1 Tax=Caenorhabditis japonica TaxID=281687 RepID=A0A8R1EM70_CAEJA